MEEIRCSRIKNDSPNKCRETFESWTNGLRPSYSSKQTQKNKWLMIYYVKAIHCFRETRLFFVLKQQKYPLHLFRKRTVFRKHARCVSVGLSIITNAPLWCSMLVVGEVICVDGGTGVLWKLYAFHSILLCTKKCSTNVFIKKKFPNYSLIINSCDRL